MNEPSRVRVPFEFALLSGVARDVQLLRAAAAVVHACEDRFAARVELGRTSAWLKSEPLRDLARWRHSLRRWLWRPALCVNEFDSLRWLRERGFHAPEPLAAAVVVERGLVRRQLVATAWLEGHRPLGVALGESRSEQRAAWIDALARDVARMHALGFVHRDLFLRNVLVDHEPRVAFIDCRRAGRPRPGRDAEYDLGCLMLEAAGVLSFEEQRDFFVRYFSERSAHHAPANPEAALSAANRRRDVLLDQIAVAPGRWRSPEPPRASWPWRELASSLS